MSLLSHRRALVLAGLTGTLLAGGTLATTTAAQADDGSTPPDAPKVAPSDDSNTELTIADAADAAQSKYPDCDVTAALFYDTAETPTWDVELTCTSGTIKYVTVDGDTGKVSDNGSTTDDTTDSSPSDDPDSTSDSSTSDNSDSSSDSGDAPGTGANDDYS